MDRTIGQAIDNHRAGRLAQAEAAYRRILRRHPGQPDALHFLGLLRFQQHDRAAGIGLVQRSLRAAPGNPHAWNNLGNMLVADEQPHLALDAYRQAVAILPTLAEAWHNLGVCLRRERRYEESIASFTRAIDCKPDYSPAFESLGMLHYRLGRIGDAAKLYRRWLSVEPTNPIARHMAAAASGEDVPERADDAYVTRVFDGFASSFDSNLSALGYRAPQLLAAALGDHVHVQAGRLDVLDAGCGTGLCGPLLRSTARTLTGVDLSPGMIEKARGRQIYDELVVGELCAFMRSRVAAYDLVLSADTLCYFGALGEPIAAARVALRPNGILAFTLEAANDESTGTRYRIQPHGRYSHSAAYVEAVVRESGLQPCALEPVILRREKGRDVRGHLVVGRAPGTCGDSS